MNDHSAKASDSRQHLEASNPFEAMYPIAHENLAATAKKPKLSPAIVSIFVTAILIPPCSFWAIEIINSQVTSNMYLWPLVLMTFALLAAIPCGCFAWLIGSILHKKDQRYSKLFVMMVLAFSIPATRLAIILHLKLQIGSILAFYASLLGIIAASPVSFGILMYLICAEAKARGNPLFNAEKTSE